MSNVIYPAAVRGIGFTVLRRSEGSTLIQTAPNKYAVTVAHTRNPVWHWELVYEILFDNPNNLVTSLTYTDLQTLWGFVLARQHMYDDFLFEDPDDKSVGPGRLTTTWQASHYYRVDDGILDPSNHWQKVTVAGTSGASMPSWNTSGGNTTDGSVTWHDEGTYSSGFPNLKAQLQIVNDGAGNYYSPIQRNMGGQFYEDITDLNGSITVFANAVQQTITTDYVIAGPGLAIPGNSYLGLVLDWVAQPASPVTVTFNYYFRVRFEDDSRDFDKFVHQMWTAGGPEAGSSGVIKLITSRPVTAP